MNPSTLCSDPNDTLPDTYDPSFPYPEIELGPNAPTEQYLLRPTTPIIIMLILWLIAFQSIPRALALSIALCGEIVMFLIECGEQLYTEGQLLRTRCHERIFPLHPDRG